MPQAQTVDLPKRLPLVLSPENRDDTTGKDARLVNGYVEKGAEGDYHLYRRPGLLVSVTKTGNGYGAYNWKGNIYTIFGATLYKDGASIGTVDSTGGVYHFSQTLGGTNYFVLGNGVKAYTWDNSSLLQITDGDFPAAFVKGWAYLDATTYVMDANANIQGSGLNNPPSWDAGNVITAQIEPDAGVALAKQLVYVIALKGWTAEVFYDAANPSGSPLGRVQGAKINYGCVTAGSVQNLGDSLIWAATTREAGVQVVMLDNLKVSVISTKPVERLLSNANFTTVFSWGMKINGHRFYVLTLKETNLTLVYDLSERLWQQWTDADGNYFPIVSATFNSSRQLLLQHETNGKLYIADTDYFNDDGSLITVDLYTPNFDAGVRRRKLMNFMEFIGDQTPGSILQVRSNDNDYQADKWTNFRNVDLSKKRPYLSNCGTFYRRAHHFRHRCNTAFRIQAVEMQLDLGTL